MFRIILIKGVEMINRAAILLRLKPLAIEWINKADPYENGVGVSLESANEERTVYLVSDHVADDAHSVQKWIELNYEVLFENELEGWYTDERLWPEDRSLELFKAWFDVECHSVIEDTVDGPVEDEDI